MSDTAASFSAAISRKQYQVSIPSGVNQSSAPDCASCKYMKADLVKAASEVIPNQQILVNMVSRRVRQLCLGHRPLVEYAPGLGHADVALTEIANQKLTFESTLGQNGKNEAAHVVQFPGIIVSKKIAAKEKAA
jgi:DNA-directed RNA polymerase subunit omega